MEIGIFISFAILIVAVTGLVIVMEGMRSRHRKHVKELDDQACMYQDRYHKTFIELGEAKARIADLENEKNVGKWLPYYNELNERIDTLKRVVMAQESIIKAIQQAYHEQQERKKR